MSFVRFTATTDRNFRSLSLTHLICNVSVVGSNDAEFWQRIIVNYKCICIYLSEVWYSNQIEIHHLLTAIARNNLIDCKTVETVWSGCTEWQRTSVFSSHRMLTIIIMISLLRRTDVSAIKEHQDLSKSDGQRPDVRGVKVAAPHEMSLTHSLTLMSLWLWSTVVAQQKLLQYAR